MAKAVPERTVPKKRLKLDVWASSPAPKVQRVSATSDPQVADTILGTSDAMDCRDGSPRSIAGRQDARSMAIVLGKGILVAVVARLSGARTQFAIASAFCLVQVGEFSFVLATIAHGGGAEHVTLPETVFRAIISATMLSLLTTHDDQLAKTCHED